MLLRLSMPRRLQRNVSPGSTPHCLSYQGSSFVAWQTHSVLVTIGVGMVALWLLRLLTS